MLRYVTKKYPMGAPNALETFCPLKPVICLVLRALVTLIIGGYFCWVFALLGGDVPKIFLEIYFHPPLQRRVQYARKACAFSRFLWETISQDFSAKLPSRCHFMKNDCFHHLIWVERESRFLWTFVFRSSSSHVLVAWMLISIVNPHSITKNCSRDCALNLVWNSSSRVN